LVVTRAASSFAPDERPRVAIASDGTLAAIHEPTRVSVVELPGCAAFAEVAVAADAANELAWIGAPPRLLLVSRYAAHTIVHLVDPYGPRTIAELRVEEAVRLSGVVGVHALLLGAQAATVVTASETQLAAYTFPARGGVPAVAGAGAECFVVAVPGAGALEEWDPQGRIPKRRVKLPHAGTVAAVGGSDRVAWCTWRDEPNRIDALPVVQRGQPKSHVLPERIAEVAAHPRSDLIVCLGAETGRIYVVDLDGTRGLRVVGPVGIERAEAVGLVVGRVGGVLAAQAKRPVSVVVLDPTAPEPSAVRERVEPESVDGPRTTVSVASPHHADARDWRYELVSWARAAIASSALAGEPPPAPAISHVIARFELSPHLRPVLALLYGVYLAGERGAAPIDVARVARGWSEALGKGELAARKCAVYEDSRVRLAPVVQRALDEA
jgi:hypothetical protein